MATPGVMDPVNMATPEVTDPVTMETPGVADPVTMATPGVADPVTMETVTDVRQPLMTTILQQVERGEGREVTVIMESRSLGEQLRSIAWDLVPQVCGYLTADTLRDRPDVILTAQTVLSQLALKANPKEVLLVLLEQADTFQDDVKFTTLLPAVQTCLLQLPAKRGHSIAICTETLYSHLAALSLPPCPSLQQEERLLWETDPDVSRVNDVTRALIDFLRPLAERVSYRDTARGKVKDVSEQKELVRCVLKLLQHPLCRLDTRGEAVPTDRRRDTRHQGEGVRTDSRQDADRPGSVPTESRLNAERLAAVLALVQPDYIKLLTQLQEENFQLERQAEGRARRRQAAIDLGDIPDVEEEDYELQQPYPELALSTLAYLTLGEGLGLGGFPAVYRPQFVLESVLPYVSCLLGEGQQPVLVHKGVGLLQGALSRVPPSSMPAELLEWEEIGRVVGGLLQTMTQSQCRDTSRAAVGILPLWLSRFTPAGRHRSLYFMLLKERHSGLVGYATQLLKQEVDRALSEGGATGSRPPPGEGSRPPPGEAYFLGGHLDKLLSLVLRLQHGLQTDLLDQSDRVMAALNLLRYLIIRDKPGQNRTGVWTLLPRIQRDFTEPLRAGIDMSRAHYQLEISKVKDGTSDILTSNQQGAPQVDFSVGGRSLPNLTPEQEMEVMHTALHTFDMMQSVLVRVEEVVCQQQRDTKL